MTTIEWADKEIKAACKRENPDWDGSSFDYGCACYQSALKAYKSLTEDGHSGYSFGFTKNILIRLLEGLPLSPITEKDEFQDVTFGGEEKTYQCLRMSSFFKKIDKNGNIRYSDIDRAYCIDIHNPRNTYTGGETSIIDELYPITLPYMPVTGKYRVYTEDFLTDKKNGDYDTKGYLYCKTPNGERIELNRFFAEKENKMVEISKEEYLERRSKKLYKFADE